MKRLTFGGAAALAALGLLAVTPAARAQGGPAWLNNAKAKGAAHKAALEQPLAPQTYHWKVGDPPVVLPPLASHLCVLTEVSGKFAGGGEKIALRIDKGASGGPRWTLIGYSGQGQLRGTAVCAPRSKFVPMLSHPDKTFERSYPERTFTSCPPAKQLLAEVPFPRTALFLTTIGGRFSGGGEALVANAEWGKGHLHGSGCSGMVVGAVTAYGDSTLPEVKFRTSTGRTSKLAPATFGVHTQNQNTSWVVDVLGGGWTYQADKTLWLVPVDEALCGIVSISGKMQGYGEGVEIKQYRHSDGKNWWRLDVRNMADGAYLAGAARCLARDQR